MPIAISISRIALVNFETGLPQKVRGSLLCSSRIVNETLSEITTYGYVLDHKSLLSQWQYDLNHLKKKKKAGERVKSGKLLNALNAEKDQQPPGLSFPLAATGGDLLMAAETQKSSKGFVDFCAFVPLCGSGRNLAINEQFYSGGNRNLVQQTSEQCSQLIEVVGAGDIHVFSDVDFVPLIDLGNAEDHDRHILS